MIRNMPVLLHVRVLGCIWVVLGVCACACLCVSMRVCACVLVCVCMYVLLRHCEMMLSWPMSSDTLVRSECMAERTPTSTLAPSLIISTMINTVAGMLPVSLFPRITCCCYIDTTATPTTKALCPRTILYCHKFFKMLVTARTLL